MALNSGAPDSSLALRTTVHPDDREIVRRIISGSGFFSDAEVDVAVELVDERLAKGPASGYEFLFAEEQGRVVGYACYGEIACTVGSYDLYWVAVDPELRGRGLGRWLMARVDDAIRELGGRKVYAETSGKSQYEPTRQFYLRCGYQQVASFPDFYAPADAKVVYEKEP
jgi:D-alanine-D-alanine ligase